MTLGHPRTPKCRGGCDWRWRICLCPGEEGLCEGRSLDPGSKCRIPRSRWVQNWSLLWRRSRLCWGQGLGCEHTSLPPLPVWSYRATSTSRETGPPCCYLSASWSLPLILGQSGGGSVPCLSLSTLFSPLGDLQVLPFPVFISKELASLCAFSYPSLTCHQQSCYLWDLNSKTPFSDLLSFPLTIPLVFPNLNSKLFSHFFLPLAFPPCHSTPSVTVQPLIVTLLRCHPSLFVNSTPN